MLKIPNAVSKLFAALYSRYSCSDQKETSIDDQARRCKEVATKLGFSVPDALVFSDAAVSGSDKGRVKRTGFDRLIAALEAGEFSLLVVDEISRLARDTYELAKFDKLITKHHVRVVTADGLDSTSPAWGLQLSVIGAMAQFSLKETTHRVKRGMVGQLERGWMIAPPPFGYRIKPVAESKSGGTSWELHPDEADTIRNMYKMRLDGNSFSKIAATLNAKGIAPSHRERKRSAKPVWLAGTVYRMVMNPIYKGVFVFHNSTTYRKRMADEGIDAVPVEYLRPELIIVSNDVWSLCSRNKVSRSGYGGGRHMFAGLITCGHCQATLTVTSPAKRTRCLTCAICNQEKMAGIRDTTPGYVSANGIAFMLQSIIQNSLGQDMQELFRARLRQRLAGGHVAELAEAQESLTRANRICKRLSETMGLIADDDPYLVEQFKKARQSRLSAEQAVKRLEDGVMQTNVQAIEAQMAVNPEKILELLFTEKSVPVELKRAVLSRLFPRIVLLGKQATNETVFEIDMVPGAIGAELTQTGVLVDGIVRRKVVLKCSGKRPTVWQLEDVTVGVNDLERAA